MFVFKSTFLSHPHAPFLRVFVKVKERKIAINGFRFSIEKLLTWVSGLPRSTATSIHPFVQYAKVTLLEISPCQCPTVKRSGVAYSCSYALLLSSTIVFFCIPFFFWNNWLQVWNINCTLRVLSSSSPSLSLSLFFFFFFLSFLLCRTSKRGTTWPVYTSDSTKSEYSFVCCLNFPLICISLLCKAIPSQPISSTTLFIPLCSLKKIAPCTLHVCSIFLVHRAKAHRVLREALRCDYEKWQIWENFALVSKPETSCCSELLIILRQHRCHSPIGVEDSQCCSLPHD